MVKVGVTGGIGSGKSTVCKIFEILGIPIFHSDYEARKLYSDDEEVIGSLKAWYGKSIYRLEKEVDKEKLAEIIYKDPFELKRINALIHPKVRERFAEWINRHESLPYVINESALLFETGISESFDLIVNVAAPLEMRIERIISRDGRTKEEILAIANKQLSETDRIKRADITIHNDDTQHLIPQVLDAHSQILTAEIRS